MKSRPLMGRDEIVAAHYSAINLRELRVETVREDRAVYMSYRIGDEVFWTKQKVRLTARRNDLDRWRASDSHAMRELHRVRSNGANFRRRTWRDGVRCAH